MNLNRLRYELPAGRLFWRPHSSSNPRVRSRKLLDCGADHVWGKPWATYYCGSRRGGMRGVMEPCTGWSESKRQDSTCQQHANQRREGPLVASDVKYFIRYQSDRNWALFLIEPKESTLPNSSHRQLSVHTLVVIQNGPGGYDTTTTQQATSRQ